jgi:hemoglobin-like flavoprotein
MEEQITWLGFRHIKYGAKAEHVKVLGDVIVETLARAVEEDWTMEMADAWSELWARASTQMFKVINEAKVNGVLVQEMWELVQTRTTEIKFGSTLRKLLLSGTEWVSSLSYGILESSTPAKDSLKSTLDFKSAAPATPATKGATMDSATPGKMDKGTTFKSIFHNDEMFEDKSSESDAIGRYFWTMLSELLTLLWEPEQQNERMIVMTTHLFHWGIRSKHLPTIGDAIGNACKRVLKADWSKEMHDGWQWWWSVTSKQMAKTLYVCEQDHARIICESWALCKERSSTLQLGELFFKELARMAPHIMHLFKRPKVIQAAQFVAVVDMLVTFVENPALFFDGFKTLTIRHIKYGVKAEYAKAFGKSILIGIEKTLGEDDFDEETREVWQMLWMRASSCVGRALNVGTNPVIVSLVQGDVEKMSNAISCAERCNRFQWLTSVDINGERISPIYWSLRDGNPTMVRYIMSDLLTLRADREKYYYGREVLFEEHADIVTLLCRECPDLLLETLFSGLMWHSKDVENGSLRVNYYIRDLYGDPNKETNVWKQALAVMVTEGSPDMFRHPLSQKLLEVKWDRFGIKCFLGVQAVYIILLILFMTGSVQNYGECSYKPLRYFVGVASFLLLAAQGFICFRHWQSGLVSKSHLLFGLQVPSWISDTCNSARVLALIFIVAAVFFDSCDWVQPDSQGNLSNPNKFVGMALNSFAAVLLWSQVLQIMVLSTRLAALTYTIGIMAEDVTRNLLVVVFFVAAFSTALTALREDQFPTFGESLLVLVRVILNVDPPSLHNLTPLGIFFLFMFIITAIVGMLNILIAQLWSSYGLVASNKLGYALQHRANICMHIESVLPTRWRLILFDEMFFDTNVPFNQGDAGPCGGIQVIEPASIRNSPYYVPDRILRFTGEASPNDPWPVELDDDGAAQGFGVSASGYSGKGSSSHG